MDSALIKIRRGVNLTNSLHKQRKRDASSKIAASTEEKVPKTETIPKVATPKKSVAASGKST